MINQVAEDNRNYIAFKFSSSNVGLLREELNKYESITVEPLTLRIGIERELSDTVIERLIELNAHIIVRKCQYAHYNEAGNPDGFKLITPGQWLVFSPKKSFGLAEILDQTDFDKYYGGKSVNPLIMNTPDISHLSNLSGFQATHGHVDKFYLSEFKDTKASTSRILSMTYKLERPYVDGISYAPMPIKELILKLEQHHTRRVVILNFDIKTEYTQNCVTFNYSILYGFRENYN